MRGLVWSRLSRGARVGVLVVLVPMLLLAPFLAYAGLAVMNVSANWARSAGSSVLSIVVGVLSLVVYRLVVFGVPLFLGGVIGSAVQRAAHGTQEGGV